MVEEIAATADAARAASGNARELAADARNERVAALALAGPALALGALVLFVPLLWLLWQSLIDNAGRLTLQHYIRIANEGAYVGILRTTFTISLITTGVTAALGYPLAYFLVQLRPRIANILMIGVLAPFWTSILVRTYAWLVLLQRKGLINDALISLGFVKEPLALSYNSTATVIGMAHIMLPFLVLPLYSTMRTIDPSYVRAAANLGAGPVRAFWQIFFPLSLPGFLAGLVLVFVLCLGFYVTPAILGGGRVTMIAQRIFDSVSLYPTWGPASALGVVLLVMTGLILVLCRHLFVRRQN
jgi:putative spermidine/putrescine transport system permease protein/spermidine/putrescine transport system permease protein